MHFAVCKLAFARGILYLRPVQVNMAWVSVGPGEEFILSAKQFQILTPKTPNAIGPKTLSPT